MEQGHTSDQGSNQNAAAAGAAGRVVAAATGAAVGLAIGGPLGAIAGAAATPLFELVASQDRSAIKNVVRLSEDLQAASRTSEQDIVDWAKANPERLELLMTAVQGSWATTDDNKVRALATVVAEALADDALLDMTLVKTTALAAIEARHVRVLWVIANEHPPRERTVDPDEDPSYPLWYENGLRDRFPNLSEGIRPIMTTLELNGLVSAGTIVDGPRGAWRVTDFGRSCLVYVDAMSVG